MAKDKILKPFVGIIAPENKFTVDTIDDLKSRNYLTIGDIVDLNGYYTAGDGAHHKRKIESADDGSGVQLANGLWANIVHNGKVNVSWFGAKGDGVTDDSVFFVKMYNHVSSVKNFDLKLKLTSVSLKLKGNVTLNNLKADLTNCYPLLTTENCTSTVYNVNFSGETVITSSDNSKFLISKKDDAYKPIVSMSCENIKTKCRFEVYGWNNSILKFQSQDAIETPLVLTGNLFEVGQVYVLRSSEEPLYIKVGYSSIANISTEHNALPITIGGGQLTINSLGAEYQKYLFRFDKESKNSDVSVKSIRTYNMQSGSAYVLNESDNVNSVTVESSSSPIQNTVENIGSGDVDFKFLGNSIINHRKDTLSETVNVSKTLINSEKVTLGRVSKNFNSALIEGYVNTSIILSDYNFSVLLDPGEVLHIPFFASLDKKFAVLKMNVDTTVLRHNLPTDNCRADISVYFNYGVNNPYFYLSNVVKGISFFVETVDKDTNHQVFKMQNSSSYPIFLSVEALQTSKAYDNAWAYEYFLKNSTLGDTTHVLVNSFLYTTLDTPYYALKMQQENVYEDFVAYMDEKLEYDKEQRYLEEQHQLAFESREDQEQTYEEWLSSYPELMPVHQEPVPSEALQKFYNEYK